MKSMVDVEEMTDSVRKAGPSDKEASEQMDAPFIVTIDGPAASGKSSVSRELAKIFGWTWVSTGAFYRGLAYIAHHSKVDLADEDAVAAMAVSPTWSIRMTPQDTLVFLGETDVTAEIGREANGTLASQISSFPKVRRALLEAQRRCAEGVAGLIAEGRDCGTVVFPAAAVKVFLTARAEDRAARRAREEGRDLDQTIDDQKRRDLQDSTRKAAPLATAEGSNTIDTTALNFDEVVAQVEQLIRHKLV